MMIEKESFNYQDTFALRCNGNKRGVFVDIGCSVPDHFSNVTLLLKKGWSGIGFDMDERIYHEWNSYPLMKPYNVDVMKSMDFINSLTSNIPMNIDYLNLDLDGYPSQYAAEKLDTKNKRYKCMTIEHDEYRLGPIHKIAQRNAITANGYEIVVKTLAEDWYVDPFLVDRDFYAKLKTIPENYVLDLNTNLNVLLEILKD